MIKEENKQYTVSFSVPSTGVCLIRLMLENQPFSGYSFILCKEEQMPLSN